MTKIIELKERPNGMKYVWIGKYDKDGMRTAEQTTRNLKKEGHTFPDDEIENRQILLDAEGNEVGTWYDKIYRLEADGFRRAKYNDECTLINKDGEEVCGFYSWVYKLGCYGLRGAKIGKKVIWLKIE